MLNVEIDKEKGIAILQPQGSLSESDFHAASQVIDPYIAENGNLHGLIISAKDFPGWESFGALVSHITFIKNHHTQLSKVAVVTDAKIGGLAEKIGSHLVSADVKHYPYDQFDSAKSWILDG
ncbi:MAG: STAS/SEC14 domain-containing protein [Gammaproteobacteria bacterium]|nr:STAS/SEC14 domain-containing protein [Gammaproteobacteria bacterium]MCP4090984.1 STAS/SEC14 domain-containing protein [Gammaproteobacteria bacterium]MCP4277490.1 STAS/SEC14 domain-containing protein [Gammaproteobacteria bacterium]MCP4831449.1 STAS/SEC14 domain-containing protein [Gammaproteobacteria bacterium]MCP4928523.1 STAS/SEC14 domain-containing protein [Gammaproteobacteria bacterium]